MNDRRLPPAHAIEDIRARPCLLIPVSREANFRPVECDVGRKVEFVVERDVEQGQEVFSRRRRRIPDFGHEGVDLKQELRLPLAH